MRRPSVRWRQWWPSGGGRRRERQARDADALAHSAARGPAISRRTSCARGWRRRRSGGRPMIPSRHSWRAGAPWIPGGWEEHAADHPGGRPSAVSVRGGWRSRGAAGDPGAVRRAGGAGDGRGDPGAIRGMAGALDREAARGLAGRGAAGARRCFARAWRDPSGARGRCWSARGGGRWRRFARRSARPICRRSRRSCSGGRHADPRDRLDGEAGVARVVQQLEGLARPAAAWERDVLPGAGPTVRASVALACRGQWCGGLGGWAACGGRTG